MKPVNPSFFLELYYIESYINIPPRTIKVNPVPSMVIICIIEFCSINNVAMDVLTTAEGGKQMSKIITDSFLSV